MIYKSHYVELLVNKQAVEFESQDSVNIRFQNVLFDPTKISSTQAEYSFSFDLPCTQTNNKIFDYANNLSKLNKFHNRWNAELYADGNLIFNGSLTLTSIQDNKYNVNLVSVKNYSLEEIFGESTLTDIPWYIPFSGCASINQYNADSTSTVTFPFVSYGAFQKRPKYKDSVASDYTSKYLIDEYNLWYMESFQPSLSLLETIKKAFEWKGYKIQGDAMTDYFLNEIFMSQNLADEQVPTYNLGNPLMGNCKLRVVWTNPTDSTYLTYGTVQDLKYPYFKTSEMETFDFLSNSVYDTDYNLKKIRVYDMMSNSEGGNVFVREPSYLFDPNENMIVIPADGWYKIDIDVHTQLLSYGGTVTAKQLVHSWNDNIGAMSSDVHEEDITFNANYRTTTPLEIQLVRNYDDDIELIKGKNNIMFRDGYPDNTTECNHGGSSNYSNWSTCFPHEKLGTRIISSPTDTSSFEPWSFYENSETGYVYKDGEIMCYDPIVSNNFILGATTMGNMNGGGCMSVIKNGYSWSKQDANKNEAMYIQNGYQEGTYNLFNNSYSWHDTSVNKNAYIDSPNNYFSQTDNTMDFRLYCMVKLNKDDKLKLFGIHRDYGKTDGTPVSYKTAVTVEMNIRAASPNSLNKLLEKGYGYDSPTEFDTDLRVSNFMNKETKISDWINNVATAFNLEITQDNNLVRINKKKNLVSSTAVDLDDRVNSNAIKSKIIEYPKSIAVKYKIDSDEHGFYTTVPQEHIDDEDWKKYGDSGYSVIYLNDDTYVTNTDEKQLQFSYTWYDNFDVNGLKTVRIPVISKEEYMIDGYDYTESMKHDGYGLPQRFWFRPQLEKTSSNTQLYVTTQQYPNEKVYLYTTTNQNGNLNLSYKTNEYSLLNQYFNISPRLSSNFVEVEVYLTPEEYNRLKNGALVHVDNDLYQVVEIQGYDPTGNELTTLKLMKKTS